MSETPTSEQKELTATINNKMVEMVRHEKINEVEETFIFAAVVKGCDTYKETRKTGLSVEVAASAACKTIKDIYDNSGDKLSTQFIDIEKDFLECCSIIFNKACP